MIGDHIRARKEGRWRHAIDCGDETVIHLVDDPAAPPAARVRRMYRPAFLAGAEVVEVVTHRERVFPARQVVARAYSRTREPALASTFRDSAAFAEWCKTGRVLDGPRNVAISVPGVPAKPLARRAAAKVGKGAAKVRKAAVKVAKAAAKPVAKGKAKLVAKGKARRAAKPAARKAAPAPKRGGARKPAKVTRAANRKRKR